MFTVSVDRTFSAAHSLRGYMGKCESLHGHNWKVTVTVAAAELDKLGMVIDFKDLKKAMDELLEKLDHAFLNEVPPFDQVNPSSENIARYLYQTLSKRLDNDRVQIHSVSVWESENSKATYFE